MESGALACFLLGLLFGPKNGGLIFLRKVWFSQNCIKIYSSGFENGGHIFLRNVGLSLNY
jgi:hypothetical protein